MIEVFYLIAFLLLPLRMKQLINNGRIKFLSCNGLPTQDIITNSQNNSLSEESGGRTAAGRKKMNIPQHTFDFSF